MADIFHQIYFGSVLGYFYRRVGVLSLPVDSVLYRVKLWVCWCGWMPRGHFSNQFIFVASFIYSDA